MAHHILKSNIYKNSQNLPFSTRQLQACFTSVTMDEVTLALACIRNIYHPLIKVSRLLLLSGADPNHVTQENDLCPLLGLHCHLGHTDMVSLLLEFGADPNISNGSGATALHMASIAGHLNILTLLIQCGVDLHLIDKTGVSAVVAAARAGQLGVVEYILDQDLAPLTAQDVAGQVVVQSLLHHQDHVADTILDLCNLGHIDNVSGLDSLGAAAATGNVKMLQQMMAKPDLNANLLAALHVAGLAGNLAVLECLISAGVDVGVRDDQGRTVLMVTCHHGHCHCIPTLIRSGAELEDTDNEGLTPLTHAIINNQLPSAGVLLQSGANVNCSDKSGRSGLDIAIYQGSAPMVELLLDNGANMETPDKRGIKPLDRVIGHGNTAVVQVFLRKGAKLGAATWAMAADKPDILLILLNKERQLKKSVNRYFLLIVCPSKN